jgi:hypothetical protein
MNRGELGHLRFAFLVVELWGIIPLYLVRALESQT